MKTIPTIYRFNGIDYEEKDIPPLFRYTNPNVPDDCEFIISPSSIGTFFSDPCRWFKENILKQKEDLPNTSMILGTICHAIYDNVHKVITEEAKALDRNTINEQLDAYVAILQNPEVDVEYIKATYPMVTSLVVNDYLLQNVRQHDKSEIKGYAQVLKGVYVAGTCDRLENIGNIVDFKTVKSKPSTTDPFPWYYKLQLLAYYYIFSRQNYNLTNMRLVYGIRPTKTLPVRLEVVNQNIDYIHEQMINNTLKLIAETYYRAKEDNSLIPLLFKSYDLKGYSI